MKKILNITIIVLFILMFSSCKTVFNNIKHDNYIIKDVETELAINETYCLDLMNTSGKKLKNSRFDWKSGDESILTVDSDGVITVKGSGLCSITASDKVINSIGGTVSIFVPYVINNNINSSASKVGKYVDNTEGIMYILKECSTLVFKSIKNIALQKVSSLGAIKDVYNFISKGNYLFSVLEYDKTVTNGILFELTNWTNYNCMLVQDKMTLDSMHNSLQYSLGKIRERGDSYSGLFKDIKTQIIEKLSNNGTYYFSKMDPKYEYRLVVRADYNHYITTSYYQNGLLTGFGLSLSDLLDMNLKSLADNYSYQRYFDEISDITNIKICVERRLK